jgi:hypothetical protein|tara:strand:- start:3522 stop:5777 length:2256 start_codon:yes stop_codon:yes gene_type:complete
MARYTTSGQKTSLEALNAELEKIAVSQEDLLSRVGDTPNQIEYNLDMNNNRILNLPPPVNPSDPVRLQDLTLPEIIGILYESDLTTSPTATSGILRAEDAYAATSINFHTGHAPDKSEVGLGNVDDTSDVNKPVSTAQSTAIGLKADTTALTAHTADINNPHSVTQTQVGLSNVNNTADADKPISTLTQIALNSKVDDTQVLTNVPLGALFTDTHTTYTVGDGGLTQVNFTTADNTKLDGIAASANNYTLPASVVHDTEAGALHATDALSIAGQVITLKRGNNTTETVTIPADTTYSVGDGGLTEINFTSADNVKLDGIAAGAEVNVVDSVAGKTGVVSLVKADVGLSNVNNTSDANKAVSTAQQTALDLKADRSSLKRQSLLDNPLCHLFKTNKLVETSAPTGTDSDITFTRASMATYVDRYGIVKIAAVDTIREEKDGFLIEQAGTNIARYSEQFDNSVWVKNTVTVTANNVVAPDGTMTADKFVGTSANGLVKQSFAATSILSTASVWLRADVPKLIKLFFQGGVQQEKSINLTTEWQRFEINSNDVAANLFLIGGGQTLGTGETIYAWGAQIEQSLVATSYIPTVATPATRIADTALLPVLNNVVTKEFSIFGIISNKSVNTNTGAKRIFTIPTSSVGFFTFFYSAANPDTYLFRYDDASAAVQLGVASTENTVYFAITVEGSNVKLNINGTEATATKLSDPSLLLSGNVLFFDLAGSALKKSNGNIKDFRIYDFALNANEIEYLLP